MKNKSYPLQILPSPTRKNINIQVYSDCTIKIKVPKNVSQIRIDEIIKSKEKWINDKIEHFKKNPQIQTKPKEYISGESFYYSGKQFKLKIIEDKVDKVELKRNLIVLYKKNKSNAKNILEKWFLNRAKDTFEERLKINFKIFSEKHSYSFPLLKIRKMKSRWGSMSNKQVMTLNSYLIHAPIECINYVIMHELCHLKYKKHNKKFYQLQENFIKNYKEVKEKLETFYCEIKGL